MLKELIAGETGSPEYVPWWRASQVGECETFLCHLRLGHSSIPFSGRVRHMLDDGLVHEHDIVDRLVSKGIGVFRSYVDGQAEVHCSNKPYVVGHPDGILDVPSFEFTLDYADENFEPSRYMLLEVTARNHFAFQLLRKQHLRQTLYPKFVQVQMYLGSEEVRSYSRYGVVIVKNKNDSELYEEGVSLDTNVVDSTLEKLTRIEDLVAYNKVSEFRCDDWRRKVCRYRHLCFEEVETKSLLASQDILRGESLSEAEQLREVAETWRRGKLLKVEGEDLIEESREQFQNVIEEHNCRGLVVDDVRALLVDSSSRSVDYSLLQKKYPEVYKEVVQVKPTRYVRVT